MTTIHYLPTRPSLTETRAQSLIAYSDDPPMVDASLATIPADELPDVVRAMTRQLESLLDHATDRGLDLWTEIL